MRTFFYRAAGVLLVISAIAGLVMGGFGIWGIWEVKPQAEVFLTDTTQTAVDAIDLADGALNEVMQTLTILNEGLQSINGVKDNLADMLTGITPVLDSTSNFVGEDLVSVLGGVQGAFETLNTGMSAVQTTLGMLPLIGDIFYDKSTPMTDGVEEMEEQVSGLTTSFETLEQDLLDASANMEDLQENIEGFASAVDEADLTLQRHLDNVATYQVELREMRQDVLDFRARWLRNIQRIAVWGTVILAWMLLLMLGVTVLGGDLVVHGDQRQIAREKAYLNETLEPLLLDKVTPQLRDQLRQEILEELRGELGLLPEGYERLSLDNNEDPKQLRDFVDGEYDEAWDGELEIRELDIEDNEHWNEKTHSNLDQNEIKRSDSESSFLEGDYSEDDTAPVG